MADLSLETMTIVPRPRSVAEVHDLALVLLRRHLGGLLLLAVVGVLPWALLDALLLTLVPTKLAAWLMVVLVFAQAPLATAPMTAYLGQAMFSPAPSVTLALRSAVARGWALLVLLLWRGLGAATVVLSFYALPHLPEVLLLERQPLGSGWRRAAAMARVDASVTVLHILAALLTIAVAIWQVQGTAAAFLGVLRHGDLALGMEWEDVLPGRALLPTIGLWLAVAYLAVVRFVAYLDLRTRHEGWDLELDLRRAGARVVARGGV